MIRFDPITRVKASMDLQYAELYVLDWFMKKKLLKDLAGQKTIEIVVNTLKETHKFFCPICNQPKLFGECTFFIEGLDPFLMNLMSVEDFIWERIFNN